MNSFQQIIVIIAIIILILCLIMIGIALHNHNSKDVFPPVIADCPDYWEVDSSGNCTPTDAIGLHSRCTTVPPNIKSVCEKYVWAKNCNITWDGISNNDHACSKHDKRN